MTGVGFFLLRALGFIILLVTSFFLSTKFDDIQRFRSVEQWATTNGTIVSSGIHSTEIKRNKLWCVRVAASYKVNSIIYEATKNIPASALCYKNEETAKLAKASYLANSQVAVHYDKNSPSYSALIIDHSSAPSYASLLPILVAFFGGLFCLLPTRLLEKFGKL